MMTMMIKDAMDDALEVDTVSLIELTTTISIIISIIIKIIIKENMIIIIITWSLPRRAPSN